MKVETSEVNIREATSEDRDSCYKLLNDETVKRNSFNRDGFSPEFFSVWFDKKLNNTRCRFYIAEYQGVFVGHIRYDLNDSGYVDFDYALVPEMRGMGLGKGLVEKSIQKASASLGARVFRATVFESNTASKQSLQELGFRTSKWQVINGFNCLLMEKKLV